MYFGRLLLNNTLVLHIARLSGLRLSTAGEIITTRSIMLVGVQLLLYAVYRPINTVL